MYNMPITKDSTTIRVQNKTKSELMKLDFVKKHTYDKIIKELIIRYKNHKKG